jgi:glycosyltransferase involved in cell wall biosynthesis
MKIAIIADPIDNQRGGIHVYTREVVKALLAYDKENEYLLIREKYDPDLEGAEQIVLPNFRFGLGYSAFRLFFIVPFILIRKKVDMVIEPAHFGPFNLPRRILRTTVIHDLTPILFPQYHRYHSQLLQHLFLGNILRKADLVLSNSQHTTRDLYQHYPVTKGKVSTILLGIDHIQLSATTDRAYLDQIGVSHPFWLYVGTIEPRKNLVRLLQAYETFRRAEENTTQLLIVGQKGWKSEPFFDALADHPFKKDIILPGFVPDQALAELYSHAIGLIYPSEYEGFGFPVLEAFSCGCPVVCSDNSSLPEVGGDIAYYCKAEEEHSISKQMQLLYRLDENQRERKKEEAINWAKQFSWRKYAEQFSHILQSEKINLRT